MTVWAGYRFEVESAEGAVQRLQIHLKHGFNFYVVGLIPAGKDPRSTDREFIASPFRMMI